MTALNALPAHQLAAMIRDRAVSSTEVLAAHLSQIAGRNDEINAICTLDEAGARHQAQLADTAIAQGETWGPLHGVPITIKDIFETAGLRTTAGYLPLKDYVPTQDATIVTRLRAAGAVIMGKTNLAELAGDYQSTNSLFPRVNNPWHVDYTPGGSSGGSAAAVAAHLSPFDVGNDFAGSVRQPAHFCGVYGLKPTDRRISTAGQIPEVPGMPTCLRHMMTVGCFARSIADLRLGLAVMAGGDRRRPDVPPMPLDVPADQSLSQCRIAWSAEWAAVPVGQEIRSALQSVKTTLLATGVSLTDWQPPDFDLATILNLYTRLAVYVNLYAQPVNRYTLNRAVTQLWRSATQGEPELRSLGNFARVIPELLNPSLQGYFEALTERDCWIAELEAALDPWDVWITPVAATTAFTHRPAWSAIDIDGRSYPYALANGAYTMPFNLSGHPAVVMPIGRTRQALPMGMQIVGKRWREMELLAIAAELDAVLNSA